MHRNSLRERYEKKRKERQDILGTGSLMETTEDKKSLVLTEGELTDVYLVFFGISQRPPALTDFSFRHGD